MCCYSLSFLQSVSWVCAVAVPRLGRRAAGSKRSNIDIDKLKRIGRIVYHCELTEDGFDPPLNRCGSLKSGLAFRQRLFETQAGPAEISSFRKPPPAACRMVDLWCAWIAGLNRRSAESRLVTRALNQ
jgi:hypothetical protein